MLNHSVQKVMKKYILVYREDITKNKLHGTCFIRMKKLSAIHLLFRPLRTRPSIFFLKFL